MFVKVINFLCEIRGHRGRTEEDGCQPQNLSAFMGPNESTAQGLDMDTGLPTLTLHANQQRLNVSQKEDDTDERKIEIDEEAVEEERHGKTKG